ncbi:MAG: hypothetical protein PHG87_03090 [Candidatus Omnitrophica bacterium]|nr:hypothetical protein [Candidatus Omnitrophota bacterium]
MNKLQKWLTIAALWVLTTIILIKSFPKFQHYEMISAWGTVAAAVIAIWAVIQENHRSRLVLNIDIILKLDERFNSREMMDARKKTAKSIESCHENHCKDEGGVLEFFGTIGILFRKGVLDKEVLWRMFFYWLHGYYFLLEEYIKREREKDPSSFDSLIYLYNELLTVENKLNQGRFISKFNKAEFLKEEMSLSK